MFGGMTSSDFGVDIVATVKANKAAAEAAQATKLEAARKAVLDEAAARQSLEDAVKAKQQAALQAAEQARLAAEETREKSLALFAWQNAGGTPEMFEQTWPEMRRKQIAERVASQAAAQTGATEAFYRRAF